MIGFKEAIEVIKLSKKSQVSLFISFIIIIFIAQFNHVLFVLGIQSLIDNLLPIVSLLAVLLFGFIIGGPIYEIGNSYYNTYYNRKNIESFLKQLTNDEKAILKPYIEENIRAKFFDMQNGTVGGLASKNILYRSSNLGNPGSYSFAYNIQDIAFNILKKKPSYLQIIDGAEND
jgi:superinfection exclusion protein B